MTLSREVENSSEPVGALPSKPPSLLHRSLTPLLLGLFALAVRLVGLTWGLPNAERWYSYHPDESTHQIVGAVVNLIQGDFNPHFFNYPSLTVYATWLIYQVMTILGLTTNVVAPEYPWPIVRDVILAGRLFSTFCGAGTAIVAYFIAREVGLRRAAILAGLLVALIPGLVQHSHFATVDVPATFFALLCIYLTLRAKDFKGILWAAFVAGLAAGTKYNVGVVLVAPLLALWLLPIATSRKAVFSLASVAVTVVAFLLTTPYALLDFPSFWGDSKGNGFYFEAFVHPKIGSGDIFQNTGNGWIYHATFNLPFVMTWPLIIGALVGVFFAAKQRVWWPILLFIGLYFFSLGFSQVRFMRYLFPIAPLLAILAAYAAAKLPLRPFSAGMLTAFGLVGTMGVLAPFVRTDPRDFDALMLRNAYRSGEKIGLAHNPWYYTVPFQPQGLNQPVPNVPTVGFDIEALEREKPRYFAISEFEYREAIRLNPQGEAAQFLKHLDKSAVKRWPRKSQFLLPGRDFVPHDYLYTSPETRVFLLP